MLDVDTAWACVCVPVSLCVCARLCVCCVPLQVKTLDPHPSKKNNRLASHC